ncbi:glycosyltransferase family 4 protein [bacterium]|nr:glycosyltransferase family 4 protein [bacterium]
MRILYIASQFPSLTETFVAREINEILNNGHKVCIAVLRPENAKLAKLAIKIPCVKILRVSKNPIKLFFCFSKAIVFSNNYSICLIEALKYGINKPYRAIHLLYIIFVLSFFIFQKELLDIDYIHCHFLHSEAIATRWLSILIKKKYGLTAHTVMIRHDYRLIQKIVRDSSICIGDTNETVQLLKRLGSKNLFFIRNGINIEKFNYQLPVFSKSKNFVPLILAVGSLLHPKGFHILIEACNLLNMKGISFRCSIIGDGVERRKLENLINHYKLNQKVNLSGSLPMNELIDLYRQASIFVMPSIPSPTGSDGLPTVIIEAMALGIPVIGSDHAAISDIIIHKKTGLLFQPGDQRLLSDNIELILSDHELYRTISRNSRILVENEYNINENCSRLINIIENIQC